MTCLKLPGGGVTTDAGDIRNQAVKFYASACREELLEGLPQLSEEDKTVLDRKLSLAELTALIFK